jgi:hypothetical protein
MWSCPLEGDDGNDDDDDDDDNDDDDDDNDDGPVGRFDLEPYVTVEFQRRVPFFGGRRWVAGW